MAKQARNTFGAMSVRLRSLGFDRVERSEVVVFTYPNGGPVILLPAYKSGEAVKLIHRVMVEKQLVDAGFVKTRTMPLVGYIKADLKTKQKSKSKAKQLPPAKGSPKVEA